jgi:hypothetical protein
MVKYFRIFSYIRKPFVIYDFATAPIWISLYIRKIVGLEYKVVGTICEMTDLRERSLVLRKTGSASRAPQHRITGPTSHAPRELS